MNANEIVQILYKDRLIITFEMKKNKYVKIRIDLLWGYKEKIFYIIFCSNLSQPILFKRCRTRGIIHVKNELWKMQTIQCYFEKKMNDLK